MPRTGKLLVVLDASALLAVAEREPGHESVASVLGQSAVSAVNLAEVLGRTVERGHSLHEEERALARAGVTVEPFTPADAHAAALLRPATRALGLSLGDRACLALGQRLGLPVMTADRAWASLKADVTVQLIR